MEQPVTAGETRPAPPLPVLFVAFLKVGATSLGGGLTSWMMHEFVRNRRWLSETDFLSGLAIAQALPGVNVVNLSIWIGYRLYGWPGAVVCASGIVLPGLVIVGIVYGIFSRLSDYPATHRVLGGAIAVAIGLSISMGLQAGRRVVRDPVPCLIMLVCFVAAGPLQMPVLPVILVLGAAGILWFLLRPQTGDRP